MRPAFVLVLLSLHAVNHLRADETGPIELTLHPRAIESPALKYRLLPAETEIRPGNAAPILLRLPWEQTPWMTKVYPTLHEWQSRPLDAPEWESFAGVLPQNFYNEMKRAAYRRDAEWEYPILETSTPYLILLPDVQGLRGFLGYGLSAKIRNHLRQGELEKAREGILVGLANGRHLAQTPFFVNQLVAVAIHQAMLARTAELIAQPESPNLYWALSALPNSMVEIDRAASLEGQIFALTFPAVTDLDRPRDEAEWTRMAEQLLALLRELGEIPPREQPKQGGSFIEQFLQKIKPADKSHLTRFITETRAELPQMLNISQERVAAMSDDEVTVRWYMHKRLARDQLASVVMTLPPAEAWPQLKRLQQENALLEARTGAKQSDYLYPLSMYLSAWSLNRNVAVLRAIEAVRHHLALHGELPSSLEAITDVPVPLDPLTNKPFEWRLDRKTATIKAPELPAEVVEPDSALARSHALEYRLRTN